MIRMKKSTAHKGEGSLLTLLAVVAIGIGVYFVAQHYKNRSNDIVIHVPKVEVH